MALKMRHRRCIITAIIVVLSLLICACTKVNSQEEAKEQKSRLDELLEEQADRDGLVDKEESGTTGGSSADEGIGSDDAGEAPREEVTAQITPDPSSYAAGTELSEEVVLAAGEDAWFTVSEISDDLFARIYGLSFKENCTVPRENLRYIRVLHRDIDGRILVGELIMHADVAEDVCDIFHQLYQASYPIEKMRLIDDYGADDNASMEDNNTSAFNFRLIAGTDRISNHAYGKAIDINPYYNPYVIPEDSYVSPASAAAYADRSAAFDYKIDRGDLCYQLFLEKGFTWGGDWQSPIDYQHFERTY